MRSTHDQFTPVGPAQNKTPIHTLIRVRNNQRRHRERRRQYITFLEEKVDHSEGLLVQARARIAELESDCRYWKCQAVKKHPDGDVIPEPLARTEGQHQPEGDETLRTALWNPETSISPDIATASKFQPSPVAKESIIVESSFISSTAPQEQLPAFITPASVNLFQIPESSVAPQHETIIERESPSALDGDKFADQFEDVPPSLLGSESDCKTYPSLQDESTVLCSHASILIAQQNIRGMDENDIRGWLDKGFRRGKHQNEGCRVETSLLFALLDFISTI